LTVFVVGVVLVFRKPSILAKITPCRLTGVRMA
jgi:hypothetical protein